MRFLTLMALSLAVALSVGCVSPQPPVTLAPVGPRPLAVHTNIVPQGSLVVYSALDGGGSASGSEQTYHSPYEIHSAGGELLKRVPNRLGALDPESEVIELAPGRYTIAARASGSKSVIVPVVIETAKTTYVHLDGSELAGSRRVTRSALVNSPDGSVVGWRATETTEPE
jgi:hypothetical protein